MPIKLGNGRIDILQWIIFFSEQRTDMYERQDFVEQLLLYPLT
jgi:hypothetical protein